MGTTTTWHSYTTDDNVDDSVLIKLEKKNKAEHREKEAGTRANRAHCRAATGCPYSAPGWVFACCNCCSSPASPSPLAALPPSVTVVSPLAAITAVLYLYL